jgi:hypothetical protein
MPDSLLLLADPVTQWGGALLLSLLLLSAAWHKVREGEAFSLTLAAWRVVPAAFVPLTRWALALIEVDLALGLLLPSQRLLALPVTAVLLLVYGGGLALNLARGRRDLDCGCGGSAQRISGALVLRNAMLAGAALLLWAAADHGPARPLEAFDFLTLAAFVAGGVLCWLLVGQVLEQSAAFAAERRARAAADLAGEAS